MSPAHRKPPAPDTRDPLDRLVDNLAAYSAASVPGQALTAILALRQAQQHVLPPGINAIGLQVSATRLRQVAARTDPEEKAAILNVAGWLERLSRL